jgi:hypothetical protein
MINFVMHNYHNLKKRETVVLTVFKIPSHYSKSLTFGLHIALVLMAPRARPSTGPPWKVVGEANGTSIL